MTLDFNGTEIWVYGAKRWNHDIYSGVLDYRVITVDTDDIVSLDGSEPVKQSGNVYDGEFQALLYHANKLDLDRVHHIQVTNTPG